MAEALVVLGALSSVFQIIEFIGKLTKHTHHLLQGGQDALRENIETERLALELQALADAITKDTHGKALNTAELTAISTAKQCQREAAAVLAELEKLRFTAGSSGWANLKGGSKAAARCLRKKKDIEKRRRYLGELSSLLSTALLAAQHDKQDRIIPRILDDLHFDGMKTRESNISEVFPNTYQWALKDTSLPLKDWLRNGNGVFWITGKPGAGKSTLMKFLYTNNDTMDLLREWDADDTVITASFYFWYLGTGMQKSIEGLLRSLLYQLMQALKDLSAVACPEYYQYGPHQGLLMKWSQADLIGRLKRLVSANDRCTKPRKFCFFIDGLDEYHGDHAELVALLDQLSHDRNVKFCVSSRPWNVFTRAYERDRPSIRLQDLTQSDILSYVHGNLRPAFSTAVGVGLCKGVHESVDIAEVDALIYDIARRAEGVFLWVHLVVLSSKRGICEGDSVETLRERIATFPPDLEDFFRKLILDRVDPFYTRQTCQALLLAYKYVKDDEAGRCHSFLDYWFILQNSPALGNIRFPYQLLESNVDCEGIADRIRIFLSAACKDLLVLDQKDNYTPCDKPAFLHRTVYDFLCAEEMQRTLAEHCPLTFSSDGIIHLLNAAKLTFIRSRQTSMFPLLGRMAQFSLTAQHENLCEDFAKLFDQYLTLCAWDGVVDGLQSCILTNEIVLRPKSYGQGCDWLEPNDRTYQITSTLIAFHQHRYARFRLENDLPLDDRNSCLLAALGEHWSNTCSLDHVDLSLIKLMSSKTVSPTQRFNRVWQLPSLLSSGSHPKVEDSAFENCWDVFLQKWQRTYDMQSGERGDVPKGLAKYGWEIAKAFLESEYRHSWMKCCGSFAFADGGIFRHSDCVAARFLQQAIPPCALAEVKQTAHLAKSTELSDSIVVTVGRSKDWGCSELPCVAGLT